MEWAQSGFDERLDVALAERGWNGQDLVRSIPKLNSKTLSAWRTRNEPSFGWISTLADALGVTPAWLAFGDEHAVRTDAERHVLDVWRKLNAAERESLLALLATFTSVRAETETPRRKRAAAAPPATNVTLDHDTGITAITPPLKPPLAVAAALSREDAAPYAGVKPLPEPQKIVNRRAELARFTVARRDDPAAHPVPRWLDLAAGEGTELRLCEDYSYFRELNGKPGIHSAIVRGESMTETLQPGDLVVLRELPGGRIELPQIENREYKVSLIQWSRETGIQDGDICVLSINGEAPTLKRVRYNTLHGVQKWKMKICADNPSAWLGDDWIVEVGDSVTFYAKVLGLGQ